MVDAHTANPPFTPSTIKTPQIKPFVLSFILSGT
jgi:hypothetical protein